MAVITGTEGPDALTDTDGVDTINALAGDDTILLDGTDSGADVVDGGEGTDRLIVDGSSAPTFIRITVAGGAAPGPGPSYSGTALNASNISFYGIEHFTAYHNPDTILSDSITTGAGDDVYVYTVKNDNTSHFTFRYTSFVNLGAGSNDKIVIDGSAVHYAMQIAADPSQFGHMRFRVGFASRIDYWNVERLEFIGGSEGDTVTGLSGSDMLDGRYGDDMLSGMGGDDRIIGAQGDDALDGGEGNDVLVVAVGTDTAEGGDGSDQLEIDARWRGAAVLLNVAGAGPSYSGNFSWSAGSVAYSGIEGFVVYSEAGNYADSVTTGMGDDVFHHYGLNDLSYLLDTVDLGGGSNDLLVADFSAVTDHVVSNRVHPSVGGHYLFDVGGNGKIDYTGVERIHFIGGSQGDTVTGLGGDDILEGRAGNDILTGGDGDDDLAGGTGTNTIDAGNDDDIIRSVSLGIDTVEGGGGFDTAVIGYSAQTAAVTNIAGGDIAFGNGGNTSVTLTGVERFIISTGSGNDSIATLGGNDEIRTGAGTDTLNAGAGNDYLDGGSGADSMTGGDGDDVYIVDDVGDTITEASGQGTDVVHASSASYTLSANVENLFAVGGGAHSLRGNGSNNVVRGEAGNDFLLMQDGGDDTANGLAGNDVIYFGAAYTSADHANGGSGRDAFVLQGNYTVTLTGTSVTGFESISLQSGANTQFGDVANNFYDFNITTANDLVPAGQQLIVNAQSLRAGEDFVFNGSAETDGKFLIYGGHGLDDLTGGAGVDVFFFEGSRWGEGDKVNGGGGRDAVVISAGSGLTRIEFASDSLTSIESISVNKQYATDPTQTPSYEFVLHNGNVAPGGTLIVNAASLANTSQTVGIDGSGVHDGNLILFGGAGNDVITAGHGADLLVGGGLADALTGGGGADTFRYDSTSDSTAGAPDLIGDFTSGTDKIDLSRIDANTIAAGDQAFTWIGSNAFAGSGASSAGQLRVYQNNGYWYAEGDTNGDGNADLFIVFQIGTSAVVQGDFIL
jgi:Ca2+-binding RTX toxin-like protein